MTILHFADPSRVRLAVPRVELWSGDDAWRASVHLTWTWRGVHHWCLWFLPWAWATDETTWRVKC